MANKSDIFFSLVAKCVLVDCDRALCTATSVHNFFFFFVVCFQSKMLQLFRSGAQKLLLL